MRRTLMVCMIMALAAMPLMAGAQPSTDIPEGRSSEGYLFPRDAHPREPSLEATPDQNLVRQAQIALRDSGFEPGRIDGMMGPRTQAALRQYQAAQGLPQTGRLDATTQKQLMAAHTPESSWQR
jgi:Putative peptidoglycan binding domain